MSDLISRSALLKEVGNIEIQHYVDADGRYSPFIKSMRIIKRIEDAPTIDAVPVVHGKWIDTQPEYHNGFRRNAHVCSNCNDYYTTEHENLYFCPRCGARMDGE